MTPPRCGTRVVFLDAVSAQLTSGGAGAGLNGESGGSAFGRATVASSASASSLASAAPTASWHTALAGARAVPLAASAPLPRAQSAGSAAMREGSVRGARLVELI